jgi:hypothetical protein
MSATVLLIFFTAALVVFVAVCIWAMCLLAGAARPMRPPSGRPTTEVIESQPVAGWRPRPEGGRRGSRGPRRIGLPRQAVQTPWRE